MCHTYSYHLALDSAVGTDAVSTILQRLKFQKLPWCSELETETAVIKLETKLIIDKVYESGSGDLVKGLINCFENGFMDVFSAKTRKDVKGVVRYLNFGNIPLNYQLKCYNKKKLKENNI